MKSMQLTFVISQSCNLSCIYCTQQHSKVLMTPDDIKNKIKEIKTRINSNYFLQIDIFGGEPLENKNLKEIINTIKLEFQNYKYEISLFTNGYLLNKDLINLFQENDIYLKISNDGLWEILRNPNIIKSKPGVPVDILKLFKYYEFQSYFKDKVQFSFSVLNNGDLLLEQHLFMAQLFKPARFYLIREPNKWNENNLKKLEKGLMDCINYIKKYPEDKYLFPTLLNYKNNIINKKGLEKFGCEGGTKRFSFTKEKSFLPCGVVYDFNSDEFNKVPQKKQVQEYCSGCDVYEYCEKECQRELQYYEPQVNYFCKTQKLIYNLIKKNLKDL